MKKFTIRSLARLCVFALLAYISDSVNSPKLLRAEVGSGRSGHADHGALDGDSSCPEGLTAAVVPNSLKHRVYQGAGFDQINANTTWPPISHCHDPWTLAEKQRGFHPVSHAGARRSLHQKLTDASAGHRSLLVVVVGGSMTHGQGCQKQRWSDNLQELLKVRWPNASVVNLAMPGTKSSHVWTNLDEIAHYQPDVILVDYAINDAYAREGDFYSPGAVQAQSKEFGRLQDMTKKLVVSLLGLPWKPALVYLETFTHYVLFGYTCQHRVDEFPHWAALHDFNVPVVSYTEAVCTSASMPTLNAAWEDDCHNPSGPHAACWVHRALSHLMADFFHEAATETSKSGITARDERPVSQLPADGGGTACALHPLTKYVAKPFGDPSLFPARSHEGWEYRSDVEGKPGWIATEGSFRDIVFDINTSGSADSAVLMEYLFTYDKVGKIRCWLDGNERASWSVDALVQAHVSLSDVFIMKLPAHIQAGAHRLRCRSDGRKFKILSVRSC